jgi:hypothetical protein
MASVDLSRRVAKVAGYPPLSEMSAEQRREFHESLLDADSFEDVPGKWRAAIIKAERNRPKLRLVSEAYSSPTEVRFPSPTASRAFRPLRPRAEATPLAVHGEASRNRRESAAIAAISGTSA